MTSEDRPRGILTSADREFLLGEKEFKNEQSRRDARYRIRNRIRNAFLDYSIIAANLNEKDREMVFDIQEIDFSNFESLEEGLEDESVVEQILENREFKQGLKSNISFLHTGLDKSDLRFEEILEEGIQEAYEREGFAVEDIKVDIDVERERVKVEELLEKLENDEDLSESEINLLIQSSEFEINDNNKEKIAMQFSNLLSEEDE